MQKADCEFQSGGLRCRGWFYQPEGSRPYPCVVMANGFGATPDGPLGYVAQRFAEAGLAAFAFDYRHFGRSDGTPRHVLRIGQQLEDWDSALAYVRGRDDVDEGLLALWGSSLSAGQVLAVATRDARLTAAVAQVPYTDGLAVARAAGWRNLKMLPHVARDLLGAAFSRPPHLIEALGPAGRPAAVDASFPDVHEALRVQAPAWRNQIAARSLLQLYRFRPVRRANEIRCPLLVVTTYEDRLAPTATAIRTIERVPYAELAMFRARHFDLYAGPIRDRAIETEVAFLAHHFRRARTTSFSGDASPDDGSHLASG